MLGDLGDFVCCVGWLRDCCLLCSSTCVGEFQLMHVLIEG